MIHFRSITEDNFSAIINMKNPAAEGFVALNSVSLAQAWLYRDDGDVFPFAIYADETLVGFMMLEEDLEEEKLWLWRIVIAPEHERKGYATSAIEFLLRLARESGKYKGLYLDCAPANAAARRVYDRLGFIPTGEINHGDVEMCIVFDGEKEGERRDHR